MTATYLDEINHLIVIMIMLAMVGSLLLLSMVELARWAWAVLSEVNDD